MGNLARAAFLSALLCAFGVGGFYAGFQSGRAGALPFAAPAPTPAAAASSGLPGQFGLFWEVWKIVDAEYIDRGALDYQRLTYGAIRGMVEALGDSHTFFSEPVTTKINQEDMRGSFGGVGIELVARDGRLTVMSPVPGAPAERAGIRSGDVIAAIDGADATKLGLNDAVSRIRGAVGTKVRLAIAREGVADQLIFDLAREEIKPANVQARLLDGSIGYVRLSAFTASSGQDLKAALTGLLAQQPRGVVLDLRNNPGGLLESAVDVASQFLRDGVVLYEERQGGVAKAYSARPGGVATDVPLVVLVNPGSASASEIVAGALQDRGRAQLVGERTYGKDTVQNVHQLTGGASVRVTFARWYTPSRQEIHERGLTPDVVVPLSTEDARAGRDPQLDRAVELLLKR